MDMLDSQSPPGKSNECKGVKIFPSRFAVTGEMEGTFLPSSVVECPEEALKFSKHGVTLRTIASGYLFLRWQGMPAEEMAVFSLNGKSPMLLTPGVNCSACVSCISIPDTVKEFYALYVRIPDLPGGGMEAKEGKDPDGKKEAPWREIAENLALDPAGRMQYVILGKAYSAPLPEGVKYVEEYKDKPGFLPQLTDIEKTQNFFITRDSDKESEAGKASRRWNTGYERSNFLLHVPEELQNKDAWLIALHDSVGMAYDFSCMHSHALDGYRSFEEWRRPLTLSGALSEAHIESLRPEYGYREDFPDLDDVSYASGVLVKGKPKDWRTLKEYFLAGEYKQYLDKHAKDGTAIREAIAEQFMADWVSLLKSTERFSIFHQLFTAFYASDQTKADATAMALPLTLARGHIFQRAQGGIAIDVEAYSELRTLFKTGSYVTMMTSVVEKGGLPGEEIAVWLHDVSPFLALSATDGKRADPAIVLPVMNAALARLTLPSAEMGKGDIMVRDILEESVAVVNPDKLSYVISELDIDTVAAGLKNLCCSGETFVRHNDKYYSKVAELLGIRAENVEIAMHAGEIIDEKKRSARQIAALQETLDAMLEPQNEMGKSGASARGRAAGRKSADKSWGAEWSDSQGKKTTRRPRAERYNAERARATIGEITPVRYRKALLVNHIGLIFVGLNLKNLYATVSEYRAYGDQFTAILKTGEFICELIIILEGIYSHVLQQVWRRALLGIAGKGVVPVSARAIALRAALPNLSKTISYRVIPVIGFIAGVLSAIVDFNKRNYAGGALALASAVAFALGLAATSSIFLGHAGLVIGLLLLLAALIWGDTPMESLIKNNIWAIDPPWEKDKISKNRKALLEAKLFLPYDDKPGPETQESKIQGRWREERDMVEEMLTPPDPVISIQVRYKEDELLFLLEAPVSINLNSDKVTFDAKILADRSNGALSVDMLVENPIDVLSNDGHVFVLVAKLSKFMRKVMSESKVEKFFEDLKNIRAAQQIEFSIEAYAKYTSAENSREGYAQAIVQTGSAVTVTMGCGGRIGKERMKFIERLRAEARNLSGEA